MSSNNRNVVDKKKYIPPHQMGGILTNLKKKRKKMDGLISSFNSLSIKNKKHKIEVSSTFTDLLIEAIQYLITSNSLNHDTINGINEYCSKNKISNTLISNWMIKQLSSVRIRCKVRGCKNRIKEPFLLLKKKYNPQSFIHYVKNNGYPKDVRIAYICYECFDNEMDYEHDQICFRCRKITYNDKFTCAHCCQYCDNGWKYQHICPFGRSSFH